MQHFNTALPYLINSTGLSGNILISDEKEVQTDASCSYLQSKSLSNNFEAHKAHHGCSNSSNVHIKLSKPDVTIIQSILIQTLI